MKKISIVVFALVLVAGAGFRGMFAQAAATIVSPASANVSSDSVTGAPVALPAITITEGATGDIHAGQQTWALPSGFVFDMASVANVSVTGTGLAGSSVVSFPDSTHFSLNITSTSTAPGSLSVGSVTPLMVKAASGTPLALGNITMSAGSINGVLSSTNFGTLTQVPGAAKNLGFAVEPPVTATTTSSFSAQVAVQDQFGNTATTDNGRSISLSFMSSTSTTGVLSGTLTVADINGLSAFSGLNFNQPATIQLVGQSTGLISATSTQIAVSNTGAQTQIFLANGTLVQLEGNPNIFIVQNGKLKIFQQVKKEDDDAMENANEGSGSVNSGPGSQNSNKGSNPQSGHDGDSRGNVVTITPNSVTAPVTGSAVTTNSPTTGSSNSGNSTQTISPRGNGHGGGGDSGKNNNSGNSNGNSKGGKGRD